MDTVDTSIDFCSLFCNFRYRATKKPTSFAAFLPLTFLFGYQVDLAYGTKLNRVKIEAENILLYERDLIDMPTGLPTLESIDRARKASDNSKDK